MKTHCHLGQLVLDLLKIDQRLLKTRPGLRITYRGLVRCLGNTDALSGYVDPPSIVGLHANVEPVTLLSHAVVCWGLDVIKDQFRGLRAWKTCRLDVAPDLEGFCSAVTNYRSQ